ncbi:MAG: CHAT domain-containing protein [Blastocatellia bacterium]|nr:CHAT domain-containing protein [Blastocatellia bacterium]
MVEATSERRTIEPRLSGGFQAGKYIPGQDGLNEIDTDRLDEARGLILKAASDGKDLEAQFALGKLRLIEGRTQEAINPLRAALAGMPDSAEARNDLGVGLLLLGEGEEALGHFDEALKLDAEMAEASFNRGLCCKHLLLIGAARAEFGRTEQIERDQEWLSEVKRQLEAVAQPQVPQGLLKKIFAAFDAALEKDDIKEAEKIVEKTPDYFTGYALYELSARYLNKAANGDKKDGERAMAGIDIISRWFVESKGDAFISDLAKYLRKLSDRDYIAELELIKRYQAAEKLYFTLKYRDALTESEELRKKFAARGNAVFRHLSTYLIGNCYQGLYDFLTSIEIYRKDLAIIEKYQWPLRQARDYSSLANSHARIGQYSVAVTYCKDVLGQSKGLYTFEAATLQFLGDAYWRLGDLDKAITHFLESTGLYLSNHPILGNLANPYLTIADSHRLRGNHSLALLYASELLNYPPGMTRDNRYLAQSASFTAVELTHLDRISEAKEYMDRAFGYLDKTPSQERPYTESLVLMRAGEVARARGDMAQTISYYSEAELAAEKQQDKSILLLRMLHGRAETYTADGKLGEARRDLEYAVDLVEKYRREIAERGDRSRFLDASHSIYDKLIYLNLVEPNRESDAFDVLEQSRARTLLDEFSRDDGSETGPQPQDTEKNLPLNGEVKPLNLAQVKGQLPENLRLLLYSVTNGGTYIFLVTSSGLEVKKTTVTAEDIDRLVVDYTSDLTDEAGLDDRSSIESLKRKAHELYKLLIEPVESQIGDGKLLCIVPDKALHFLPFCALVDGAGQYFIKSHRLIYAPSASVLIRCIEESRAKAMRENEKLFAVGNPRFSREEFANLEDLQDAEREVRESAVFYSNSLSLVGANATKRRVMEGLKDCDVAHLALHCLVEGDSSLLSALVLAGSNQRSDAAKSDGSEGKPASQGSANDKDFSQRGKAVSNYSRAFAITRSYTGTGSPLILPQSDDLLYLNDVYGMRLPRMRLVVLSACQSGLGQYYRGEGVVSLVRPFLASRVPAVVASLWSVDSRATADLMIGFHRERTSNRLGAGDALRAAQIKMAESGPYQHPYFWAPFIAVGSND